MLHSLGKERVIAIPLPNVIEWDQEQIGVLQLFEHHLTIAPAGDRITERTGQGFEKGRLE